MTSREQFLRLFHISDFLAQRMEDYCVVMKILCETEPKLGPYRVYEEQFLHGVAGVISCLMRGGDREVVQGIQASAWAGNVKSVFCAGTRGSFFNDAAPQLSILGTTARRFDVPMEHMGRVDPLWSTRAPLYPEARRRDCMR